MDNKKETNRWFQAEGQLVPMGGTKYGFIRSISYQPKAVKGEKVKENLTIRKQDRVIADGSDYVDAYTKEQYNDFGWARANNVLTAKENSFLRSKFADALSHQANPPKSKSGEYMIAVGEDFENKIVYMKGTIDSPIITRVLEIDWDNETELSVLRREIYEYEHRGIRQTTSGLFRRYDAADFRGQWQSVERKGESGFGYQIGSGTDGGRNRSETKRIARFRVNDDGSYTETYADGTERTFFDKDVEETGVRYQARRYSSKNANSSGRTKKTPYNEFNTNAMQWAKASSRKSEDVKVLYDPRRKKYCLIGVSDDSDMGFIELDAGTRSQMERERDFYSGQHNILDSEKEGFDALVEGVEFRQGDNNRDYVFSGQQGESESDGGLPSGGISQGEQETNGTGDSSGTETDSGGIRKQDRAPIQPEHFGHIDEVARLSKLTGADVHHRKNTGLSLQIDRIIEQSSLWTLMEKIINWVFPLSSMKIEKQFITLVP